MPERTADMDVIRIRPHLYVWGEVVKIHDIGRYTIVEHDSYPATNSKEPSQRSFAIYVDGENKHTSALSMDKALLLAVAFGNLDVNAAHWAGRFAADMMGIRRDP